MSAEHVGWAFRQPLPATRKFVLVALADRCNKDTLRCDPSIGRLAEDTGLDRSTVIRAIAALEEGGYVTRVGRTGSNGTQSNSYEFPSVGGRTDPPPPSQAATTPRRTVRPEPEVEPEVEPSLAAAPQNGRPRNEIWDALADLFGEPTTRTAQTLRGKTVSSLRAAGATRDEVFVRAKRWALHFDHATMTAEALEKHWDTLPRKPLRRTR